MNNLETAVPFMKQLEELLRKKTDELNANLNKLDIREIDFETSLIRIQEQINSAETKYTIAFVGTFKTGKSTTINSLLNLQGNARLSSEYDPDTAKCIRIMRKVRGQKFDAEILFTDTYPAEQMNWTEAKKYTSQVALSDSDSEIKEKAKKIDEVRYYVDNPFLDVCNILDLPGTGTGAFSEHTEVTDRKIMEADCIFWVVSTDGEPDNESIKNLEKFSTKMLPIINVWQSESDDIYSVIQPQEIKDMLLKQFGAYFASAEDPVFYYAKEIDLAQQEHRELKEEWGKKAFTEKVEEILSNIQSGDRMKRIKKQISIALMTCENYMRDILESPELISMRQSEKNEGLEISKILSRLSKAQKTAGSDIKEHSKKTAQEILDIFSDASDSFIENQMQGMNWNALFKKKKVQEELKKDFENNYVNIKSGWLDKMVSVFSDEIMSILQGIYTDFAIDMEISDNPCGKFNISEDSFSGFVNDMVKIMSKDMASRIMPTLLAVIGGGIMMLIPGGLVFDALVTVVAGGIGAAFNFSKDEKLQSKIKNIQRTSKNQIRQQRFVIINNLNEAGKSVNDAFYKKIEEELNKRRSSNEQRKVQLTSLENEVKSLLSFIAEQCGILKNI